MSLNEKLFRDHASFGLLQARDMPVLLPNVSVVLDLRLDRINHTRKDNITQDAGYPSGRDLANGCPDVVSH